VSFRRLKRKWYDIEIGLISKPVRCRLGFHVWHYKFPDDEANRPDLRICLFCLKRQNFDNFDLWQDIVRKTNESV